jgi:hypothetical protein
MFSGIKSLRLVQYQTRRRRSWKPIFSKMSKEIRKIDIEVKHIHQRKCRTSKKNQSEFS